MFMATLDNLVMTNALPVLHTELGAEVEELQWFMNAYTLAFAERDPHRRRRSATASAGARSS